MRSTRCFRVGMNTGTSIERRAAEFVPAQRSAGISPTIRRPGRRSTTKMRVAAMTPRTPIWLWLLVLTIAVSAILGGLAFRISVPPSDRFEWLPIWEAAIWFGLGLLFFLWYVWWQSVTSERHTSARTNRTRVGTNSSHFPESAEDYSQYVEHPRFGKSPRYTGLDPNPDSPGVNLHWNTNFFTERQLRSMESALGFCPTISDDGSRLVHGTAVKADLSLQTPATFPVTHYFDIDTVCHDCRRRFIFFADEQKYWYETLKFPLEAGCIRCPPCRRRQQSIARKRKRYDELFQMPDRNTDQNIEMAECCLTLMEQAVFSLQKNAQVRMLLKKIPEDRRAGADFVNLWARLVEFERTNH